MSLSISDVLAWSSPLVTVVGWFLVNRQNNSREFRKEIRSAVDSCKKMAREVTEQSVLYWTGHEESKSWKIKYLLEELEVEICRLPVSRGRSTVHDAYVELVEAITTADFDSSNLKAISIDDRVIRDIRIARQHLFVILEDNFSTHY